jgi:hypothetical protein
MTTYSAFMIYWAAANAILKSHGLPPMMYGEAMDYWKDAGGVA